MNGRGVASLFGPSSVRLALSAVLLASVLGPVTSVAQDVTGTYSGTMPLAPWPTDQLDSGGARHSPAPIGTPGEMRVDLEILSTNSDAAVHPANPVYPKDPIKNAVLARAHAWLDSLSKLQTKGIHLTPYGQLAVSGDQVPLAQKQLADRLAQGGLSQADKGFVYYAGVAAFSNREHPDWIPIAQKYLTQLIALGSSQNAWQFDARSALAQAYYDMGQRQQALTEAQKAYPLLLELPFEDHLEAMSGLHLTVCDILLGTPSTPEGLAKMHAIDSLLGVLSKAPEDRIRLDSMTLWMGQRLRGMVAGDSMFAVLLGHPSPAIVGNVWVNRTDTSAYKLDDGKIHVLDFFSADNPNGQAEAFLMTRLQQQLGVVPVGIAYLSGHWGMQFVQPEDEAHRWGEFFQDSLKVTFPVSFFVHPKVRTPWGGFLPPENPNLIAYHVPGPGGNGVVIVDGHGRPRRFFMQGRDQEEDMVKFITMLQKEEQH